MKKQRGFTLVEMLAVIVVLSIISLIATPIIIGVIDNVKKAAFERSVELLVKGTDLHIHEKEYDEIYTYKITNGVISDNVQVNNTENMYGIIQYNKEGKSEYAIHNNKYCIVKTLSIEKPQVSEYSGGCGIATDFLAPTLTLTSNIEENIATLSITVFDDVGLSESNKYQYYLSSSGIELIDGNWKDYINSQEFNVELDKNYYIWVYPVKDRLDNVNDNKTFNEPYVIGKLTIKEEEKPIISFERESETSKEGKIIITSNIELSDKNKYEYYVSTDSNELKNGSWKEYENGKNISLSKESGTYYIWIYPISDINGKINDNYLSIEEPYMLKEFNYFILPEYTFIDSDGNEADNELIYDGEGNWRIKFLESGIFTPLNDLTIDVFLVGGGGGGGAHAGGGGGGGKTTTDCGVKIENNKAYSIKIGSGGAASKDSTVKASSGGATSISVENVTIYSVAGGTGGASGDSSNKRVGGSGGSGGGGGGSVGGSGGLDGSDGNDGNYSGGSGQGNTTREFHEEGATLYAGGGGGGGGGSSTSAGKGGSGIVIIRNSRTYQIGDVVYTYTGMTETIDDGNGNFRIKFKSSGVLVFKELPENMFFDAFAGGGGGGGGAHAGGGGGGGYTTMINNLYLETEKEYSIVVGLGGNASTDSTIKASSGGSTYIKEDDITIISASGGSGGASGDSSNKRIGGAGGSGGGGGGSVGGAGGLDGSNGSDGDYSGGSGQGNTTREFYEEGATLYAGGGGGGNYHAMKAGGEGGGGNSGWGTSLSAKAGQPNTGGGGGGGGSSTSAGKGGTGILIIRNSR